MNLGGQRQHPRVQLDTAVRLRRSDEGPWLNARVVDLSEGGVGLQVHEGMPVGAEVRCSLPLLGARGSDLELRGVVAWIEGGAERQDTKTLVRLGRDESEPSQPRRSMGVSFGTLAADEAERIRTAVRAAAARPCHVVLSMEGRAEPITARAEPTAEGLVLRAALPVVRIGASVGVRFGGDGDGDSVVGVVKSVSLAESDGAPELRIELVGRDPNAPPASPAETEIVADVQTDPAADTVLTRGERLEDQTLKVKRAADAAAVAHRRSGASPSFVLVVTLLGIGIGIVIGLKLAERWPLAGVLPAAAVAPARAAKPAPQAAPAALVAPAPVVAAPSTAETPTAETLTAEALTAEAPTAETPMAAAAQPTVEPVAPGPPALDRAPTAVPVAPAAAAATVVAPAATALPVATDPAASVATASAEPVPPAVGTEPAGQGLQVLTLGRITRVRIPISGSAEGMRVYGLSSPGLTVNLPAATTPLQLGNFAVNVGLARRVWLRKDGDTLQVRVIYTRTAVHPEVSAENGALTIDLTL